MDYDERRVDWLKRCMVQAATKAGLAVKKPKEQDTGEESMLILGIDVQISGLCQPTGMSLVLKSKVASYKYLEKMVRKKVWFSMPRRPILQHLSPIYQWLQRHKNEDDYKEKRIPEGVLSNITTLKSLSSLMSADTNWKLAEFVVATDASKSGKGGVITTDLSRSETHALYAQSEKTGTYTMLDRASE
eukprot:Awhi_evm1s82